MTYTCRTLFCQNMCIADCMALTSTKEKGQHATLFFLFYKFVYINSKYLKYLNCSTRILYTSIDCYNGVFLIRLRMFATPVYNILSDI